MKYPVGFNIPTLFILFGVLDKNARFILYLCCECTFLKEIICCMKPDKKKQPEEKKENLQDKTDKWIDKAEEFIDNTAEKIHKSETYRKADKSVEKATKKLFRKAGKLWGKSEKYVKSRRQDKKNEK